MDCLEAQAILSAAHDGEVVAESDIAAAREHCEECPDCATFESGLRWFDVMPVPSAPAETIDATLRAVAGLAAQRAEEQRVETERTEADPEEAELAAASPELVPAAEPVAPRRSTWLSDQVKWAGIGAVATVAVTALIAFVVLGSGTGSNVPTGSSTHGTSTVAPDLGIEASTSTPGAAGAPAPAPARAPDYILYQGLVYSPGSLLADSSSATPTIGTVSTAFAGAGAPQQATVYASPLTDGSIVVAGSDGLRLYSPVVRLMQSVRYQLAAGNALDRFGEWPTLPQRFPAPTSPDGSPVFTAAGVDSSGVRVYAATGQPVTAGFAVAPGTSTGDPAAGNPNWTWWQPVTTH